MTKLKKNLMLRVIKKRLDNGENIEDIFKSIIDFLESLNYVES